MMPISHVLYSNDHFIIEHCRSCSVPGYLIVSAREEAGCVSELKPEAQACLSPTLSQAARAVRKVIQPDKVYCAQFGEEGRQLHFHVFPRTREITEAFLVENPSQRELIHGPVLLDWAREKYNCIDSYEQVGDIIATLQRAISAT